MKRLVVLVFLLAGVVGINPGEAASAYLKIESAPIFADTGTSGANPVTGSYHTAFNESFTFGTPEDTGEYTYNYDPAPPNVYGWVNYWIFSEAGNYPPVPGWNQMVVQFEGESIGGQGGMFDIMANIIEHDGAQPLPTGKELWRDSFRIGVYDIPFPSEPDVKTNSRIQNYILLDNHNPADGPLNPNSPSWQNVDDDDGFLPIIQTSFDADGLDFWYEFDGSMYIFDALEDSALRLITFFEGELPGSNGNGQVPEVPLPAAIWLLGSGLACMSFFGRRRMNNHSC